MPGPSYYRKQRYNRAHLNKKYGSFVHADYAAYFFRYGFASRFVKRDEQQHVLDIGCGPFGSLARVLSQTGNSLPEFYLGLDVRKIDKPPVAFWAKVRGGFDVVDREAEIENREWDLVVCLDVLQAMHREDGKKLLRIIRRKLRDDNSRAILSTATRIGRETSASNFEWGIRELQREFVSSRLEVVDRFGTVGALCDLVRVIDKSEQKILDDLSRYYGPEVLSCFLAPLHPDVCKNNIWVLKRKTDRCDGC